LRIQLRRRQRRVLESLATRWDARAACGAAAAAPPLSCLSEVCALTRKSSLSQSAQLSLTVGTLLSQVFC
jgi:hypothetical protein